MHMNDRKMVLDGMMGLVVGDALGCPVQFLDREELRERGAVTKMEGYGTYNKMCIRDRSRTSEEYNPRMSEPVPWSQMRYRRQKRRCNFRPLPSKPPMRRLQIFPYTRQEHISLDSRARKTQAHKIRGVQRLSLIHI